METKRFSRFQLVVENVPGQEVGDAGQEQHSDPPPRPPGSAGSYQLLGDVLTRFSDTCTNTVTEASAAAAKEEVQVLWTAPPAGSGCVAFKASVVDQVRNRKEKTACICQIDWYEIHPHPILISKPLLGALHARVSSFLQLLVYVIFDLFLVFFYLQKLSNPLLHGITNRTPVRGRWTLGASPTACASSALRSTPSPTR